MDRGKAQEVIRRIEEALTAAATALSAFVPGAVEKTDKPDGAGPVTEADRVANQVLKKTLLRKGEGWLSEESADGQSRLSMERLWVVDPIDGTLEFVSGIPEWCISVGYVENGRAVAGGIHNPATGELFLGSKETGVTYNGKAVGVSQRTSLAGAVVLASRSELKRGEWDVYREDSFHVKPMGSVAYKLARVAAGLADATWTLSPKNEWDIAGGIALIEGAGGFVACADGSPPSFNNARTLLPSLIAAPPTLKGGILDMLGGHNLLPVSKAVS